MVFTLQLETRMPAQHYESASIPAEMERKYKLQAKDTKALAVPYHMFQLEGTNSFVFHIYTSSLSGNPQYSKRVAQSGVPRMS